VPGEDLEGVSFRLPIDFYSDDQIIGGQEVSCFGRYKMRTINGWDPIPPGIAYPDLFGGYGWILYPEAVAYFLLGLTPA
jgi:hypothetical protein